MEIGKRLERALRRRLFGAVFGRGGGGATVDLAAVRSVLVVRANFRMGNLLLVTPALAALRRALPAARIDVIGPRGYVDLLRHGPDVDGAIGVERRTLLAAPALARLLRRLRRERYDLAIDGGRGSSLLGAVLVGLSGARWRVARAGSRYARLFNVHVGIDGRVRHKVDLSLALLEGLGIPAWTRAPRVTVTAAERAEALARWQELGLAPGAIGVHVGGRGRKRWAAERLAALVRLLHAEHGGTLTILAGPEDAARLGQLAPRLPPGVRVAPRMGVREFAAFLSLCRVLVTQDSGPLHLAAAVGVPTVALLAAPRSATFVPRGDRDRAVFAGAGVGAVLAAVRTALRTPATALPAH